MILLEKDLKMGTSFTVIRCNSDKTSPETILSSGEYFTGSIYHDETKGSWTAFNLVNKEKMAYILSEVDFSKGVEIEIFAYVRYPKDLQQQGDWRGFI